jgi:hypothetical protein
MKEELLTRIRNMFDVPVMQNNSRGLWIETMVFELLRGGWKHAGTIRQLGTSSELTAFGFYTKSPLPQNHKLQT